MFALYGWAAVQLDLDGGIEPWYGVCEVFLVELDVQRTIVRAAIWA